MAATGGAEGMLGWSTQHRQAVNREKDLMQIIINTEQELSATDKAALRALIGDATDGAATAPEVKPAAAASTTRTPAAKKAAPAAKKAAAKPEPTPEPDEPEDAAEDADEADDDVLGGDDEPTKADAVARATELVGEGEAKRVKAALAQVGARKVSELKDEHVAEFYELLAD